MRKKVERRGPRWWAVSIAIHVVVVAMLGEVVFRYPLGQLRGIALSETSQERLQYIAVPSQPTESSGGRRGSDATQRAAPAPLEAPRAAPITVPPPRPVDSSRSQAAGGRGAGFGDAGSGLATGLVPREPDPRIALMPGQVLRVPRTIAEDVDSIVDLVIGIVKDSMTIASGQRKPGDWTVKGKDGQTWGWDHSGIRLGKFTIPQALLALLPLNVSSNVSPIEARSAAYIRRDIMENAQRSISEDEFRAAVKRIRERKEREKREKQVATDGKGQPVTPE